MTDPADKIVSVRLTKQQHAALVQRAERAGCSVSELLRRQVDALLTVHPPRPAVEYGGGSITANPSAPGTTSVIWQVTDGR